jgi:hypothetical protein
MRAQIVCKRASGFQQRVSQLGLVQHGLNAQ